MTKREGELPDTILTLPHKKGIIWDQLQLLLSSLPRYPSMEPAVREEGGQVQVSDKLYHKAKTHSG